MSGRHRDPASRFFEKVDVALNGCWLWTANRWQGYGRFYAPAGRTRAHRWAYEHLVGPIPSGLQLDHLCRQRACVNPDHLQPVTGRENTLRGHAPSAAAARRTHCPQEHPYDDSNTYVDPAGFRHCRICRANRVIERRHRERMARR